MNTAWTIDWVSSTFKTGISDLDVRKALSFGFPLKTWTQTAPKFGYKVAFVHPFGIVVMANYARPEMGVHVILTGRSLKELSDRGVPGPKMLDWVFQEHGKVTRLDLAIDVLGTHIDLMSLGYSARVKDAPGTARKVNFYGGNDGQTVYVGSRSSEKFMRIYDKAAEQKMQGALWTRFELELKGDSARAAASQMMLLSDLERPEFIKGLMKSLYNPDVQVYQDVINAQAIPLETSKDVQDNTVTWLMNSVARTLAKTMVRRADIDVYNEFIAQVHANLVALGALEPPGPIDQDPEQPE